MRLRVVRKSSLSDRVFEQLAREIVWGGLPAGGKLPSERSLVHTFKVNRRVVRDALKRLAQLGLVRVAQGGTTALDFKRSAGLELLTVMAEYAEATEDSLRYWLAVHEMRCVIASDAARLCALRASADAKQRIVDIAQRMAQLAEGHELFALDLRFWEEVIDGSENIAYRLSFNSLVKSVLAPAVQDMATQWSIYEIKRSGYRVPIAEAICGGDATSAHTNTHEAMGMVLRVFAKRLHPEEAPAFVR